MTAPPWQVMATLVWSLIARFSPVARSLISGGVAAVPEQIAAVEMFAVL